MFCGIVPRVLDPQWHDSREGGSAGVAELCTTAIGHRSWLEHSVAGAELWHQKCIDAGATAIRAITAWLNPYASPVMSGGVDFEELNASAARCAVRVRDRLLGSAANCVVLGVVRSFPQEVQMHGSGEGGVTFKLAVEAYCSQLCAHALEGVDGVMYDTATDSAALRAFAEATQRCEAATGRRLPVLIGVVGLQGRFLLSGEKLAAHFDCVAPMQLAAVGIQASGAIRQSSILLGELPPGDYGTFVLPGFMHPEIARPYPDLAEEYLNVSDRDCLVGGASGMTLADTKKLASLLASKRKTST